MLQTSVSVSFGYEGAYGSSEKLLRLERDDAVAPYGTGYARLYSPEGESVSLFSNSGAQVSIVNSAISAEVDELLIFTGSDSVSFSSPNASAVQISSMGNFIDLTGEIISQVSLVVDTASGQIFADRGVYGVVRAIYTTTYQRVATSFAKKAGVFDLPEETEFIPLIVVATMVGANPDSITIDPPLRSADPTYVTPGGGPYSAAYDDAKGESLSVEVDSTFPVSLSHNGPENVISAVARVFVYVRDSLVSPEVSSGYVFPDPKVFSETIPMVESLQFMNSQSTSVAKPPVNGVSVSATGTFFSQKERLVGVDFATGGQNVALVEYLPNSSAYRYVGYRKVEANEVVVTSFGHAVPVTGLATAQYSTRRLVYIVRWFVVGDWFPPVLFQARDSAGRIGATTIEPPPRKGT